MQSKKTVLTIRTSLLVFLTLLVILLLYKTNSQSHQLEKTIPQTLQAVVDSSYLNSLAQTIRYYDEVLTQSARNYALTGDVKWEKRYNDSSPILDRVIQEAIHKGTAADAVIFTSIDIANQKLVKMERDSLALVDATKKSEALSILESTTYNDQKTIYQGGLDEYLQSRKLVADSAFTTSITNSQKSIQEMALFMQWQMWLVISCWILLLTLYVYSSYIFSKRIS